MAAGGKRKEKRSGRRRAETGKSTAEKMKCF
jgi:hypothetical protein